ncbi:MAG: hypothetical protein ACMXYL_01725 [Candidatus Woesearchaeota archaeon]
MGHTISTQKQVIDTIIMELKDYRRALSQEEKSLFDKMIGDVHSHVGSISNAGSINTWALFLLSIMLEQKKEMQQIIMYDGNNERIPD